MANEPTTFSQWLEEQLADKKISQVELARRIGKTREQVRRILNGESGTKRETVESIALAIGERPEKVLRIWLEMKPIQQTSELTYVYDAEPKRTNHYDGGASSSPEHYEDLSPDGQDLVNDLVRQIWEREQRKLTTHGPRAE